jgi:hypothetical protein
MAARAYADRERLQFTVIDFLVSLDHKQNPLMMKPEDLMQHDFISFQRLSRSMMDQLHGILKRRLEDERIEPSQAELSKPQLLIMQRPELITSVLEEAGWEHMKVFAYPAKLAISEKPLNVGTVPFRHWGAIQEATCRLNPNIRITLDPPAGYEKNAPIQVHTPAPRKRDQTRPK